MVTWIVDNERWCGLECRMESGMTASTVLRAINRSVLPKDSALAIQLMLIRESALFETLGAAADS
jgi:hypothetical protein